MANLNQMELQNLRHFIGASITMNNKITDYANNAVDPQVKQLFTKAEQDSLNDSLNTKQTLMSFLEN